MGTRNTQVKINVGSSWLGGGFCTMTTLYSWLRHEPQRKTQSHLHMDSSISFPSECLGWQTFFAGSNLYLFRIILDSECNVLWSSQLARDYWTLTARIAPVKNPVQISVAVEVEEVPRDENYINLVSRAALSIRWVVLREGVRSTMNCFRWRSYSHCII